MERRTDDPAALADLFRLDHLTTRMRRHAESLIVLSGAIPARGWRDPVPVVDVLRAAVAEVEDYVRVEVITESPVAVIGKAVNDVIHLFAELIENATAFSPPTTRVVIKADEVGSGFAAEIEDRGLGLTADELADINPLAAAARQIATSMRAPRAARLSPCFVVSAAMAVIILAWRSERQLLPALSSVPTGTHLPLLWWMNRGPVG